MNISSAGASPPAMPRQLVSQLTSNGLTAEKASLVATEATAAFQSAGNMRPGPAHKETVKAALEQRISADVASGKLSAEDAKAVYKTFEELDPAKQNGGQGPDGAGGPPPGGPGGPPPGGGTGGPPPGGSAKGASGSGQDSSSTNKTTVSETTTIIGEIEFTKVVYSDGTTETTQQNVGGNNEDKSGIKAQNNASAQSNKDTEVLKMIKQYLASLEPGTLFDRAA